MGFAFLALVYQASRRAFHDLLLLVTFLLAGLTILDMTIGWINGEGTDPLLVQDLLKVLSSDDVT